MKISYDDTELEEMAESDCGIASKYCSTPDTAEELQCEELEREAHKKHIPKALNKHGGSARKCQNAMIQELSQFVVKVVKPCIVCHNFGCPFMARIRSYDPRRHLCSPFALSREHGLWAGDEWSGMALEDCLDLLVKFKKYYDKPPELMDYEAEREQQKQDLAKEREVAENLKLQQTEQAHQDITANDDEEEECREFMRPMLKRNKKKPKSPRLMSSSSDSESGVAPPPKRVPKKRAPQRCSKCGGLKKGHKCKYAVTTKVQIVAMV